MASDVETLSSNANVGPNKTQENSGRPPKEKKASSNNNNQPKKLVEYSKDKLLELKTAPLSHQKPKVFVDDARISSLSCLKGAKQGRQKRGAGGAAAAAAAAAAATGRERSDTPPDEPGRPAGERAAERAAGDARKTADPRERLKSEEESIVLSPQRRSFTTGCQAPAKPKEEEVDREIHRELPTRRIGSGRLVSRDEPRGRGPGGRFDRFDGRMDKSDHRDRDRERFDEKRGAGDRDRRGGFGRDWMSGGGGVGFGRESQDVRAGGFQQGGGRDRRRGDRAADRRRAEEEAGQPEWFSAGPTSQHDMIELHGFEDAEQERTETAPAEQGRRDKPEKKSPAKQAESVEPASSAPPEVSRPADVPFLDDPAIQSTIQHHRPAAAPAAPPPPPALADAADFNLDDILRLDMDSLPLEVVGGGSSGPAAGSRFSQWFRRQSPPLAAGGPPSGPGGAAEAEAEADRRCSLQDELVGNILNGIEDLSLKIPASEPDAYFAPISPAHSGDKQKPGGDILSLLQRAPQQTEDAVNLAVKLAAMGGKTHNVADLEADLRPDQSHQSAPDDGAAFRRLVSQLRASEHSSGRQKAPQPSADPFGQLTGKQAAPQLVRPAPLQPGEPRPPSPPAASVAQDNLLRLLQMQQQHQAQEQQRRREHQQRELEQQQQQQQQQQMAVHNLHQLLSMQRAASPAPPSPLEQLMAIPEARNILIGLQTGRLTRQNLIQQLHSQVLQPRLREIIVAVLRLPQRASPLPEPLQSALRPPQQQGRGPSPQYQHLAPAPPPPHRVPSPQEIRIHTQNILQQALIKRKLEEQKENFRKRQENRERSPPLDAAGADADRRRAASAAPASLAFTPTSVIRNMKAEARGSPEHRPKGRPLVKTQPDGGHPSMSAGNIQSVAAKLLETRAQMQHHQQQQAPWLRAGVGAPPPPPTLAGNPLARWFSPEVLASAHAGQLPHMPAQQRVMSVEELERHQVMN